MAMKCIVREIKTNFVFLGIVMLMIFNCKAQSSSKETTARFLRHMQIVKDFPCGLPQQRSIRVEELLGNLLETSEIAQPHVTVLHRCDGGTGCCEKAKECKMIEEETISLHFYISDSIRNKKSEFREFKVKNHTKCSCELIKESIK